jgi:hypothetical protein
MADMQPKYSDRGFAFWEPIKASYGAEIDVHESSAAAGPHLWINIEGDCHLTDAPPRTPGIPGGVAKGSAAAHLTMDAARALRDQLDAAIRHSEDRFERFA